MARTIAEIKKEMTGIFIANDTIKALYELEPGKEFEAQFSKVSLESILFYVVAVSIWTLENLFDRHRQEVSGLIAELKPHTLRWYASKAKAFQFEQALIPDSDRYANTGLTGEGIAAQQIVKYAAVVESGGFVSLKVATETSDGVRTQLSDKQQTNLEDYFSKIKDAGVRLIIVNKQADVFDIDIDIYYDVQVFDNTLSRIDAGGRTVHDTIARFVENLPFNGEYRNSALIAALLAVEGVVLVELHKATANGEAIDAKCVPGSGYFCVDKDQLKINAIAYETVSN